MAKKMSTIAPTIDAVQLGDLVEGDSADLEPRGTYEGQRFPSADLSARDLAAARFSECEFVDLAAHNTDFRSAGFVETRFERLDATALSAPRSRFRDVTITQSRLGSAELYETSWKSVHISGSKLGFVNLRGADLQDVLLTGCVIDELDLGGATAARVSFVDTRVNNLDLSRAHLSHVDLRGLEMKQITGIDGLKGATVSADQLTELAPLLAAYLGIKVEG